MENFRALALIFDLGFFCFSPFSVGQVNMMMKQDQEKRHVCKLCNKSFFSGKVLGGHMRSHIAKNSTKTEKKLKEIIMDCVGGGEAAGSYGLRENPKKSRKFSGSEEGVSGQENLCKICGKGFDSMRALFGHMRHHSGKRRKAAGVRCIECDQEFESLRALSGHMKSHPERIGVFKESASISTQKLFAASQYSSGNSGLIRRKRSRRLRYKISPNSSFANLSENSYVTESEQEVFEVAITLLMLSRGVRNRDGFSSATESSDNNSATFEVKSPNQTQTNGGRNYFCDNDDFKMKKQRLEILKCCLSNPKNAFGEKQVSKFGENDSGFVSDEGKIVKLEVSIDRLYKGVAYKMPNLDGDTENKNECHEGMRMSINPLEVEPHENFTEEISLDPAGLGSFKSSLTLSKKARIDACFDLLRGSPCSPSASVIFDDYKRKNEYKCRTCNKIFHSHQALGGHQTIHRTSKTFHALQIDDPQSFSNTKTFSEIEADYKVVESEFHEDSMVQEMDRVTVTSCETKEYKCPVCFKVFASGQALGGHKRAHFSKDSENGEEQNTLLNQELSDICDKVIDFGVRIEDEAKADVELKSWWVKNDHKHELLVGLIPN